MRKFHILLSLFAVLAFSAVAATSAFAEGELLFNGGKLGAEEQLEVESTGELLLEDTAAPGSPALVCSGIFDGKTLGGTLFFINELLMLNKEALDAEGKVTAKGTMIDCKKEKLCEGEEVLVTVLNFPWHVEIELMLVGGVSIYLAHFLSGSEEAGKEPTYDVDCVVPLIGLVEDGCSGLSSARLINGTSLEGFFNKLALTEAHGAESENANCTVGGNGTGLFESFKEIGGTITPVGGGTLSVSG